MLFFISSPVEIMLGAVFAGFENVAGIWPQISMEPAFAILGLAFLVPSLVAFAVDATLIGAGDRVALRADVVGVVSHRLGLFMIVLFKTMMTTARIANAHAIRTPRPSCRGMRLPKRRELLAALVETGLPR